MATLEVGCDDDGKSKVLVVSTCKSIEEIDDLIAWLELAKTMMLRWEDIKS